MDDFGAIDGVALILLVAFGWVLHLREEEPGEFVLFCSMLLGLGLAINGLSGLVPWLWFGTTLAALAFYVVRWRTYAPKQLRQVRHRKGEDG